MIFDQYKLINIAIPKTGTQYMFCRFHDVKEIPLKAFQGIEHKKFYQHAHIKYIEYEQFLSQHPEYAKYKTFTFVRNPYSLALSIYCRRKQTIYKCFLDFCKKLEEITTVQNWFTQFEMCKNAAGTVALDFVGKFEHYADDWATLKSRFCPSLPDYTSELRNQGLARNLAKEYAVEECRDLVYKVYEKDFTTFSYSKDIEQALK